MYRKLLAALVATTLCAPAIAIEPASLAPNSTMFYISIPLDGKIEKDRAPSFGMAMRGSRDYQVLNIDSKFVNNMVMRLEEGEGFAGIGATWLIVGGVAAAAALAVGSSGKSSVQTQQQQQQQAAAQQAAAMQRGGAVGAHLDLDGCSR